ncbi:MAG: hypothetical protein HZC36_06530 [Armatimonadetes bacterium]|nr:hypothetical protein [Armatimonadota bacterium]
MVLRTRLTSLPTRYWLGLGLAALSLGATASPVGPNYWPFKKGNSWTFVTLAQGQRMEQVVTCIESSSSGGATTSKLDYQMAGRSTQQEIYRTDAKGLWRVASGANASSVIKPSFPVIQFPLKNGKTWTWKGQISVMGRTLQGSAKMKASGPENVAGISGSFRAWKVHVDLTVSAQGQSMSIVNDYWFAEGVGLVRQVATVNGMVIDGTLSKFKVK